MSEYLNWEFLCKNTFPGFKGWLLDTIVRSTVRIFSDYLLSPPNSRFELHFCWLAHIKFIFLNGKEVKKAVEGKLEWNARKTRVATYLLMCVTYLAINIYFTCLSTLHLVYVGAPYFFKKGVLYIFLLESLHICYIPFCPLLKSGFFCQINKLNELSLLI